MAPVSGPAYVCTLVTVGSGCDEPLSSTYVNQLFTLTALVSPSCSVTVTCTRPAPSVWSLGGITSAAAGNVTVMWLASLTLKSAAGTW